MWGRGGENSRIKKRLMRPQLRATCRQSDTLLHLWDFLSAFPAVNQTSFSYHASYLWVRKTQKYVCVKLRQQDTGIQYLSRKQGCSVSLCGPACMRIDRTDSWCVSVAQIQPSLKGEQEMTVFVKNTKIRTEHGRGYSGDGVSVCTFWFF